MSSKPELASAPLLARYRELAAEARRDAAAAKSSGERSALQLVAAQWAKLADDAEAVLVAKNSPPEP